MKPLRILLAALSHETNSFADEKTDLNAFTILRGKEILDACNDGSPLGAFVGYANTMDWQLIPTVAYRALPSGMVCDNVLESFWQEFTTTARQHLQKGIDAIYLVLHGAMVAESTEDVEGTILERIRALPGAEGVPLFGSTDLHGNFTAKMARYANLLSTYRENPHTDAAETGLRAGQLLERALRTKSVPRTRFRQLPLMWPPTGTGTGGSPMRELEVAARRLEAAGHWSVNVYSGFALADIRDAGVSIAIADDFANEHTDAALDEMEKIALAAAAKGFPLEWPLQAALDDMTTKKFNGPVVIIEPSDNVGGGGPGDCTSILRALVTRKIMGSAVVINDAAAVKKLSGLKEGDSLWLSLGGKGSTLDPGPLGLEVTLLRHTDGVFQLEDPHSHMAAFAGLRVEMGDCALVKHEGTIILLTSKKTAPMDLGQWTSQGIDPRQLKVIAVKAAVAHRQAYDKIASASYTVATPGPCSSDLKSLPYRKVRRPIAPLDPLPDIEPGIG